jgi:glycosyltransferase involved in cell wall biosynthesis
MSVYNGEKYLREAVDSILNQTFKDFEFIIINDGSTDETLKILNDYNDPRIKIINNKENIGLTRSLNKGLKLAKGEYIARQDADDISIPERLEKELNFLKTNTNYAAVGSFIKVIGENGKELHTIEKPITDEAIKDFLKKSNCIAHGSSVIRMSCLQEIGFYDETIPKAQDYDLWLRLSEKYKLKNIPEYFYLWRCRKGNISVKNYNEQIHYVEVAKAKAKRRKGNRDFSDNSSSPEISILMANFNKAEYLGEAIQSILNQTLKNWELIIVDDASMDDSVKKIRPFLNDKRIRFFENEINIGYVDALNKMVYESRAAIFGILDSDDVLTEDALEKIYEAHIKNPDCGFIYSQFIYCDSNLNPLKVGYCKAMPPGETNLRRNYASAFRTFKKRDYFKTEGFDKEIVGSEDKDIIYKMEEVTRFFFLDEILYKYRVLSDSQTHESERYKTSYKSFILAKTKAFTRRSNSNIPNLTIREISKEIFRAIKLFLRRGEFKLASVLLFGFLNLLRVRKDRKRAC